MLSRRGTWPVAFQVGEVRELTCCYAGEECDLLLVRWDLYLAMNELYLSWLETWSLLLPSDLW